ncbi:MAG: undecaprenyldiphospho-muramoylpentapeptide beta-N-acetylglucosaminyltransferase [Proteiniphilum sp.]|jgi:UDP-N-acetylglucosamine--N-acetylmuramyl-(pentapeptide) pyrophosphoryl-undecaprenol N-acetylglucosamine transferase|nr:undecaprenyldiphospho-muramoylpentapeptide beta-N-acetylglucosaminyltransferase [Proteiniphilum sp.]NCD14606.1 undecaprenyldiphospho-muramoylpentapeptide beta-N-acetylglucosaminyltransferase [Bacteroidia bacterium]HHT35197.1 undecaprenyldiphospho-muramoylpentapeptide beta-N-acetylglucosaminyltransferase [Bacteroidales bacterium]MDD2726287.1 undecaprenyldiphospho-muramoylpentapeptide beta-N-acetylglucosaminyltransferase [Proteiniphilum sp.]MDD3331602.1 undecaprenyldiphospho-muramoylpentapepti
MQTNKNNGQKAFRVIVSGGGTGGHIFPAISIANAIRERWSEAEILFVGALGRMEMERVPAAGYRIIGLPVAGFDRKNLLKNVPVAWKLFMSMRQAKQIVKNFRPAIAVGVGGYASGPVLKAAAAAGVPTLLQEQNSYAGVTNRMLAKKASVICVAYEGMEQFFPREKIVLTGNPCRQDLVITEEKQNEGYRFFGLDPAKKTILVLGGSLGARTLNESVVAATSLLAESDDVQVVWQCGKYYFGEMQQLQREGVIAPHVHLFAFLSRMDLAYAVADLVISRAGAGSISEFCLLQKAVVLVPSPNVAEDHQTRNAEALVKRGAAVMVPDQLATEALFMTALSLVRDERRLQELKHNIAALAQHDSARRIVDEIAKIVNR